MLTKQQHQQAQQRSLEFLTRAGIILTPQEASQIEVADFGLDDLENTGLQLVTYVNTSRVCAKELILFPRQTCPEHRHPPIAGEEGKEETFRCRWGQVFLYIPGEPVANPRAVVPLGSEANYTVWHEIILNPGEQFTLPPNTTHWFQSGSRGAVVSEFSTRSRDEADYFTDPAIQRAPKVAQD